MKKIIFILFLTITFCNADYIVSGSGNNKGEAYLNAMSKAPNGRHWVINSVIYSVDGEYCTIVWKEK